MPFDFRESSFPGDNPRPNLPKDGLPATSGSAAKQVPHPSPSAAAPSALSAEPPGKQQDEQSLLRHLRRRFDPAAMNLLRRLRNRL